MEQFSDLVSMLGKDFQLSQLDGTDYHNDIALLIASYCMTLHSFHFSYTKWEYGAIDDYKVIYKDIGFWVFILYQSGDSFAYHNIFGAFSYCQINDFLDFIEK